MKGPLKLLMDLWPRPATVPPTSIDEPKRFSAEDLALLKRIGVDTNKLKESLAQSTQINFERTSIYREVDRAILHWMCGSSVELYADYATAYNTLHNASVWITSDSKKYQSNLTEFLEAIGVEEKIFDWGWTAAAYGDLFVGVEGEPGVGVVHVDDSEHPANISRVDYKGALVGFYRTPFETGGLDVAAGSAKLLPPWEYVHFRVLGAKKKRPAYGDPTFSEYRTVHLMGPESRQVTSKYGTSVLINGIPIYKRLRLAEDSLLLARLTRGILKYVYKIKVDGMNVEAAASIIDEYMAILKRARALNTDPNDPNYDSKSNPLSSVEDLFIPVWGDVNDISIEEIGGKTDIKWIVDVEELRNQLASALRCPLALLGGYVQEASGQLGSEAISQLDIRFARSARRIQRALIEGITRLCQIHLAFQGMDPDPRLFDVQMSETSTAEEQQLRDSLDTSVDVIDKFLDMLDRVDPRFDKLELMNYFNQKLLKLSDLDLQSYIKEEEEEGIPPLGEEMGGEAGARAEGSSGALNLPEEEPLPPEEGAPVTGEPEEEEMTLPPLESKKRCKAYILNEAMRQRARKRNNKGKITRNLDFMAALPLQEGNKSCSFDSAEEWETKYGRTEEGEAVMVKVVVHEEKSKSKKSKKGENNKEAKSQ